MKIKIKYEVKDVEGVGNKAYTKTFSQVNEAATPANFKAFADAYLGLVNEKGHGISYVIYKTNEEKITDGSLD